MKYFLNRLILLIVMCIIACGFYLLLCLIRSKPITVHDFYLALIVGIVLWAAYILTGRMKDWPFK